MRGHKKTHDFRWRIDILFPHAIQCSIAGLELLTLVVGGSHSEDGVTEAHSTADAIKVK